MSTFPELPEHIVRLCQANDVKAHKKFVKHYKEPVYLFLSYKLGRGPHVDDLAQETFARAWQALPRFDLSRGERVWPWLRAIALNLAKDWKKKKVNGELPFDSLEELLSPDGVVTPEKQAALAELRVEIQEAANKLNRRAREVFELVVLDGCSIKQVAERLNVPEGTVKSRYSRALEFLRERLRDWGGWVP